MLDTNHPITPTWHSRAYFGLHYDLHAGLQDTELGAALTHEHLKAELLKINPDFIQCDCKGHPGIASWPTEVGTPSPGIVNDALRIHRDVTRELGIPLVVHYSGVWDNQAVALHPDWARIGPDGAVAGKEGFVTGATCTLSPYATELMIPQMMELIDKYDVDGFWVDGDNWAARACYCERCLAAFKLESGIADPPKAPGEANWDEWAAFHRRNFVAYVTRYADAVHERKPACSVCSNWMYTVGQPDTIAAPVDYLSGDFIWKWSLPSAALEGRFMDGRRLTNPNLTWDLMAWGFTTGENDMGGWTFKTAPGLCQEAGAVMGLGGSFLMYNNPQRSGHLTGWHQDIMAEVARFAFARRRWCEGTRSASEVAVLHNAPHFYHETGDALISNWNMAHKPVNGALQALLENNFSVDVIGEDAVLGHLGNYKLLVIPEQSRVSDMLYSVIADWVEVGGRLIVSGAEAVPRFVELGGIRIEGEARGQFLPVGVGREATTVKGPWLPLQTSGATVLHGVLKQQDPKFNEFDMPASTLNVRGAGKVAAVPGPLFSHFGDTHYPRTRKLVGELVKALEPEFSVKMQAPARVQLTQREKGSQLILHLLNTGSGHPLSPSAAIIEDVPRVGPIRLEVKLGRDPAAVYLAPSMESLAWSYIDGVLSLSVESIGILDSVVIER